MLARANRANALQSQVPLPWPAPPEPSALFCTFYQVFVLDVPQQHVFLPFPLFKQGVHNAELRPIVLFVYVNDLSSNVQQGDSANIFELLLFLFLCEQRVLFRDLFQALLGRCQRELPRGILFH